MNWNCVNKMDINHKNFCYTLRNQRKIWIRMHELSFCLVCFWEFVIPFWVTRSISRVYKHFLIEVRLLIEDFKEYGGREGIGRR